MVAKKTRLLTRAARDEGDAAGETATQALAEGAGKKKKKKKKSFLDAQAAQDPAFGSLDADPAHRNRRSLRRSARMSIPDAIHRAREALRDTYRGARLAPRLEALRAIPVAAGPYSPGCRVRRCAGTAQHRTRTFWSRADAAGNH